MLELNVATLSQGGAVERFQDELSRVIANITDPNTPAKKTRTVTLKMTIKPNEQRNMAEVLVATSSTVCPAYTGNYQSRAAAVRTWNKRAVAAGEG